MSKLSPLSRAIPLRFTPLVLPDSTYSLLTLQELKETNIINAMIHYAAPIRHSGVKYQYIGGLKVAPACQGQGVESTLMKWSTDKADKEGVYSWVSSSMDGHHAYARAEFMEVGRQELRLNDYAQEARRKVENEDGEEVEQEQDWGVYIWR